jgi:hypothetical protein
MKVNPPEYQNTSVWRQTSKSCRPDYCPGQGPIPKRKVWAWNGNHGRPDMVAHPFNPIYWGSRDQEDGGSRPVQAKSFTRPHLNH